MHHLDHCVKVPDIQADVRYFFKELVAPLSYKYRSSHLSSSHLTRALARL
jgi:hypothetical protein